MHISIKEVFGKCWGLTKPNIGFLALLFLVFVVIQMVIGDGKGGISFLLNLLLGTCSILAWTRVSLDVVDGKKPSVDAISAEFKHFLTYLGSSVIFQVALVVGLVLLIVPGLYVLVTYCWAPYLISEKKQGVVDSLKQSKVLAQGVRWQILKLILAIIGLNILGLLALIVGLFVTVPMSMIASALVYRALVTRGTVAPSSVVATPSSPPPAQPA